MDKKTKSDLIDEILTLQDDYDVPYPATESEMRFHWTMAELNNYKEYLLKKHAFDFVPKDISE